MKLSDQELQEWIRQMRLHPPGTVVTLPFEEWLTTLNSILKIFPPPSPPNEPCVGSNWKL